MKIANWKSDLTGRRRNFGSAVDVAAELVLIAVVAFAAALIALQTLAIHMSGNITTSPHHWRFFCVVAKLDVSYLIN